MQAPTPPGLPLLTAIIMVAEDSRDELQEFLARVGGQIIMLTSAGPAPETMSLAQDLLQEQLLPDGTSHLGSAGLGRGSRMVREIPHSAGPAWLLSPNRRDLRRPDGRLCGLTTAEYEALFLLHAAAPAEISRAELAQRVLGRAYRAGDRAIDTLIYKLREKIGADVIVTLRGRGYAFAEFPVN